MNSETLDGIDFSNYLIFFRIRFEISSCMRVMLEPYFKFKSKIYFFEFSHILKDRKCVTMWRIDLYFNSSRVKNFNLVST